MGWVLWHISTIRCYLMPNPPYILNIYMILLLWPTYTIMNSSSFINTNPILLSLRLSPSRVEHIHYSLGGAGLGHTLVGHVGWYIDLVGCVLVTVAVGWGVPWLAFLSFRGLSHQALTLFEGARFIAWHQRCLFLGEYWRGLRHFWSCQVCLGYGPAPGPT